MREFKIAVTQCDIADALAVVNQDCACLGGLLMVLVVPYGSPSENWPLGADHLNLSILLASEELNNSSRRMEDVSRKARERAYMIELHMLRSSNCVKAVRSSNIRVMSYSMKGGANLLKIGKQDFRNPGDYREHAEENAMIVKLELKKQVCASILVALAIFYQFHDFYISRRPDQLLWRPLEI